LRYHGRQVRADKMETRKVNVWKPIGFSKSWEECRTTRLDALLPSWTRKRQTLKEDSKEYKVFMDRLKRQHAIETGIVERLYDLHEGITETFIKEGFVESYLQHGDTNIPPGQLMAYLQDNFDAIDFVFDVVKNDRPLTKSFIKELHQLVVKHQDTAEGRDMFGNRFPIPLLKGAFKENENNPTRRDGGEIVQFIYCPPVHVEAEMDKLIELLEELEKKNTHPLLTATWLHHAFTQIHPFQDGNGRMARLLASLILVKHNLFPLTVRRHEKKRYIDSLEMADKDEPQKLVDYFGETQKRNIEAALNLRLEVELSETSFEEVTEIFSEKVRVENLRLENERLRNELAVTYTEYVTNMVFKSLSELKRVIENRINGNAEITIYDLSVEEHVLDDIKKYASIHKYQFNSEMPMGVKLFTIFLKSGIEYNLYLTVHGFGLDKSAIAIAPSSFFRVTDDTNIDFKIALEPYTISLSLNIDEVNRLNNDIKVYIQNILTLVLAQISSELN